MSEPDTAGAPIFIVGRGRSGTSLLRAMLVAHPRIHLAQEAMFFPWTQRATPWESGDRRLERWLASFSFAWLGIGAQAVRRRFPPPVSRERLPDVHGWALRELARRHGKARWGDKTPPNAVHLAALFAAHPDARVILTVRDPRDAILSLETTPFASGSRIALLLFGRVMRAKLAPWMDRVHAVRLEYLANDPARAMRGVLAFVGEPWDDAVLAHHEHVPEDDPPYPWTVGAERPVHPYCSRWAEELSPAWVRIVEKMDAPDMERHGYARAELAQEPSRTDMARAVLADLPHAVRFLLRATRTFVGLGRRPPPGPAASQRLILSLNPRARTAHPDWVMPEPPAP